jgi:hypothetical protein
MSTPDPQELAEYLKLAEARAIIDNRMHELKRSIVLSLNPNEVRTFSVDGVVMTVDRRNLTIGFVTVEPVPV